MGIGDSGLDFGGPWQSGAAWFDRDFWGNGPCPPRQGDALHIPSQEEIFDATDSYLFEFIHEACVYFQKLGFISCDPAEVFAAASNAPGDIDIELFLKTFLVHGYKEEAVFHECYGHFVEEYFHKQKRSAALKQQREKREREHEEFQQGRREKIERLRRTQAEIEKMQRENESPEYKKAKEIEKKQQKVKGLDDVLDEHGYLKNFVKRAKDGDPAGHDELMRELKEASKKAMAKKNAAEIMKALQERAKLLQKVKTQGLDVQLKDTKRKIEDEERKIRQEEEAFQKEMERIVKEQSATHRPEFNKLSAKNAVQAISQKADYVPDKAFNKLTEAEKQAVIDYIRDNARKFRTKLSRKVRCGKKREIDVAGTVKKACGTNGIPLKLEFKKPVRQKSNLILILDVSGSCKEASEMMLVFMHAMKEVFPGGCRTYAFTNKLYDISKFFDADDADAAAKAVLKAIPRAGAYSDYNKPLKDFYENHMSDVTGDSYVYFIGDARNNKNASGEEYMKAIARKAKKAFWLNTEKKEDWDTGDSIMGTYAKYMTEVVETVTPAELLGFIAG